MSVLWSWSAVGLIVVVSGLVGFVIYEVDRIRSEREEVDNYG